MANSPNRLTGAVVGDSGDTRIIRIDGVDDLDAVSAARAFVWKPGVAPATLTAAVVDATARTVSVELGTWLQNTATAGDWLFEIELDTASSSLTWPSTPATLHVRAEGN